MPAGLRSFAVVARAIVLAALVWAANAGPASAAQEVAGPAYTNRLIDSNNPYLLLHAHNPVDWYPWGPEALELARREHRPIFLSVGYSTCYWCHVAERTIYSDPAIAASMNAWFVNIKVDREQRPDIDNYYIVATQVMTGRGGWPNNVFLTPDLKPFFAGSYFAAADDAAGRPGFASILKRLHEAWVERPQELERKAASVYAAMRERWSDDTSSPHSALAPAERLRIAREALMREYDSAEGGFGGGRTKFPRAPALTLLLADYRASGDAATLAAVVRTLDAMALGGLHDHLAGGFHRYSTDRSWSVPHFEKMLYDNAQLLDLYTDAFEITRRLLYRDIAAETANYLVQRLSLPGGGFAAAQDAEVDGIEGASYLWSRSEIEAALGDEDAPRFFDVYDLAPAGGGEGGAQAASHGGVLRARAGPGTAEEASVAFASLGKARALLLALRDRRPQPARDDKIVVGWNALAIVALARSSKMLARDDYLAAARGAAERIWSLAADPASGALRHEIFRGRAQTNAFLDDYALLGNAFLTLEEVTGEAVWLAHAVALADAMPTLIQRAGDPQGRPGSAAAASDLPTRPRDEGDSVMPSGSSAAVALLSRLFARTHDLRYAKAALLVADDIGRTLDDAPARWPIATAALSRYSLPTGEGAAPAASAAEKTHSAATLDTADHVRASGTVRSAADRDELTLTLTIEAGFHVNANPATFDYVVPTALSIEDAPGLVMSYPAATLIRPPFAPEGMKVYEGTVTLTGSAPAGTLARPGLAAILKVQACNDQGCLAPARLAPHLSIE